MKNNENITGKLEQTKNRHLGGEFVSNLENLEKFKKEKNKKKGIIISIIGVILLIGGISLYRTFALYEEKKEFNVLKGQIVASKTKIVAYIDGVETTMPEKEVLFMEDLSCTNGIESSWDYKTWKITTEESLKNSTCTISFLSPKNFAEYIEYKRYQDDSIVYDETADNNLRYIGTNPDNYVKFNNELWRIIGVMNNIEDSEGDEGSYIKLIRNESIGEYYWSGSSSNQSNDWTKSTLNTEVLNGTYYDSLTNDAKNMINSVVWNLGGESTWAATASTFYTSERGTEVYNGRPITWTGKISLMYASDYGYAVGGSVRDTCLASDLNVYHNNNCYTNDWLYNEVNQLVLTPDSSYLDRAFEIYSMGFIRSGFVYDDADVVRPVLYLKTNIEISTGDGSETNPFELVIKE